MATIDIGGDAINDVQSKIANFTRVSNNNVANDSGTIDTVNIFAQNSLSNCKVAIFSVSGNDLTVRSVTTIGTVTGGSAQQFTGLSLEVVTGDVIGLFFTGGTVWGNDTGGSGVWLASGDKTSGTNTFTFDPGDRLSINGTGITPPPITFDVSDTISIGEAHKEDMDIDVNDTVTISENITIGKVMSFLVQDTINIADNFIGNISIKVSSAIIIVDSFVSSIKKIWTDEDSVSTDWTDEDSIATTFTDETPITTNWTEKE